MRAPGPPGPRPLSHLPLSPADPCQIVNDAPSRAERMRMALRLRVVYRSSRPDGKSSSLALHLPSTDLHRQLENDLARQEIRCLKHWRFLSSSLCGLCASKTLSFPLSNLTLQSQSNLGPHCPAAAEALSSLSFRPSRILEDAANSDKHTHSLSPVQLDHLQPRPKQKRRMKANLIYRPCNRYYNQHAAIGHCFTSLAPLGCSSARTTCNGDADARRKPPTDVNNSVSEWVSE